MGQGSTDIDWCTYSLVYGLWGIRGGTAQPAKLKGLKDSWIKCQRYSNNTILYYTMQYSIAAELSSRTCSPNTAAIHIHVITWFQQYELCTPLM